MSKKTLTSGVAAAALVASIGLAYAQTSSESPPSTTSGPDRAQTEQTTQPSGTMTTPSTTTAPADTTTTPSSSTTTTTTTPEPSTSTTVTPPASEAPTMSTTMDEPAPRADRN
jgi:hypothetical protein